MNLIDGLAVVLIVFAALAGYRSGALPQLGGILGAIAGAAVALALIPAATGFFADLEPLPRAIVVLGGILGAVAVGEAIGSALGAGVGRSLGRGVLSAADRILGLVVGVAQALLIVWLAGGLLALGPLPRLTSQVQSSTALRAMTAVLPPPGELAAELGSLLDASGLPDVFLGLEPVPAAPVDVPTDPRAQRIADAARASMARVSALACGATLTGTAFAVAPGYLVTNAHVVAGSDRVRVTLGDAANTTTDATVVAFDPKLDVAVLRAPKVSAPVLRFATKDPVRGAIGAALGYPQGGRAHGGGRGRRRPLPGDRPRHLRRGPGPAGDPRAPRGDRAWGLGRAAHPGRWDGGRGRVRGVAHGSRRRLRARPGRRERRRRPRAGPDRRGRHRTL